VAQGVLRLGEKIGFQGRFKRGQGRFLTEGKRQLVPSLGGSDGEGAWAIGRKSGAWYPQAQSVRG
jgi:hypothetical protein